MGYKIYTSQPDKSEKKEYNLEMNFHYSGVPEAWQGRRRVREALLKLMAKDIDRYLDRMAEEIKRKPEPHPFGRRVRSGR
jgi:hypothetical protein